MICANIMETKRFIVIGLLRSSQSKSLSDKTKGLGLKGASSWPLATYWQMSASVQTYLLGEDFGLSKYHCNVNKAHACAVFKKKIKPLWCVQFKAQGQIHIVYSTCLTEQMSEQKWEVSCW